MQYIIVDGHCDSILEVSKGIRSLTKQSDLGHLDFPRLKGRVNLQFMALFIEDFYKPHNSLLHTLELIDLINKEIRDIEFVEVVLNKKDLITFSPSMVKVLLAIEGGEALAGSLGVLRCLFRLGIRVLTLTWNNRNELGDGCGEEPFGKGLSKFGREVVKEMNDLGMVIDVSHLAERGFWDVIEITNKPIIASHSCCKSLASHVRNLSDEQLKALARVGGVIGINFYPKFLNDNPYKASIDDVVRHIVYASEIMGPEHVGLGSDFDGIDSTPDGLEDVTKINMLIPKLEKAGFSSSDIANIMGNNFLRVLKKVLPNE
ncbi:MAG: rane dipeptidase [Clostridia bacterium]|nr:rane dipeptidase [Clostridia bacterium]MDN5324167.1 rane dipeptidase [Clostridia bacterium]